MFVIPNPFKAIAAAWRVAVALILRRPTIADELTRNIRDEKCRGCPRYEAAFEQCRECGCFIKLKTLLRTEKCPLGKW